MALDTATVSALAEELSVRLTDGIVHDHLGLVIGFIHHVLGLIHKSYLNHIFL